MGSDRRDLAVIATATGEVVGAIGEAPGEMFAGAAHTGARATADALAARERADALKRLAVAAEAHRETLGNLAASEAGQRARTEVDRARLILRMSAMEAPNLTSHMVRMDATSTDAGPAAFCSRAGGRVRGRQA